MTPIGAIAMRLRRRPVWLAGLAMIAALAVAAPRAAAQATPPSQSAPSAAAPAAEAATETAAADLFLATEEEGWQTYVNGRFGTRLDYPVLFVPGEVLQGGDGRRFRSEDAMLEVFGWRNEDAETVAGLAARLTAIDKYETLARREVGDTTLTLAGEYDGKVFHEHYVVVGETVQAFGVEYPTGRDFYEPLVERMQASFQPGEAAVAGTEAETDEAAVADTEADEASQPPVPRARESAASASEARQETGAAPADSTEPAPAGGTERKAAASSATSDTRPRQAAKAPARVLRCGVDIDCVDPGVLFAPRSPPAVAAPPTRRVLRCGVDVACVGP